MSTGILSCGALLALAGLAAATAVSAENLIYRPQNPGLGGNPNAYEYLLEMANIQNQHRGEQSGSGGAVPGFSFPPIVIDLGGVDTPVDPTPTPQE